MVPPLKVAVIGAGAAGLAVGRALKTEGLEVVIYEKSEKLGGTWLYDPRVESDPLSLDPNREIVHSSLYHSLRTNLPRELMGFPDYPFSTEENRDPRTFPGHEEVLQFLNEFATKFRLAESIRFKTEVIRVERVDLRNDRWVVESKNNESSSNELFDAVVVCIGHHTIPNVADFPGREKWPGKQIHSHNYRVPDPYKNQIVVVIGDGPSGRDISVEISKVAKQVHLSSKSPNFDVSNFECRDNMWQHPKIDEANENGEVVFEDGVVVNPDIILHCTGFKYDFPFLKSEGIVRVEDGRVGPLYKHVFPPKLGPNLSFVGLPYRRSSLLMCLQRPYLVPGFVSSSPSSALVTSTKSSLRGVMRYFHLKTASHMEDLFAHQIIPMMPATVTNYQLSSKMLGRFNKSLSLTCHPSTTRN